MGAGSKFAVCAAARSCSHLAQVCNLLVQGVEVPLELVSAKASCVQMTLGEVGLCAVISLAKAACNRAHVAQRRQANRSSWTAAQQALAVYGLTLWQSVVCCLL